MGIMTALLVQCAGQRVLRRESVVGHQVLHLADGRAVVLLYAPAKGYLKSKKPYSAQAYESVQLARNAALAAPPVEAVLPKEESHGLLL